MSEAAGRYIVVSDEYCGINLGPVDQTPSLFNTSRRQCVMHKLANIFTCVETVLVYYTE